MELTNDQQSALNNGQAVDVTVGGKDCVLLSRDVYNRVKQIIEYDDSSWTKQEKQALLQSFGKKAGWDDPELDVYEEYRT